MGPTPDSPRSTAHRRPSLFSLIFAAFTAAMTGLAAGALWLLLILAAPGLHASVWLALPLGLVIGWVMRHWIMDAPVPAAVLAGLTTLLACAYMRVLLAAAELAGTFGMTFMQALHRAGWGMLLHLSRTELSPAAAGMYALAALLAAGVAWRTGRKQPAG